MICICSCTSSLFDKTNAIKLCFVANLGSKHQTSGDVYVGGGHYAAHCRVLSSAFQLKKMANEVRRPKKKLVIPVLNICYNIMTQMVMDLFGLKMFRYFCNIEE